ncbi:MAG: GNAT family N-acetyltransferase [Bacteriovoracaceae bacterium]|nr:GNAT family N-acetyltransferase [Bacteriovoracaceae bacterium]
MKLVKTSKGVSIFNKEVDYGESFVEECINNKDKSKSQTFAIDSDKNIYIGGCGYFRVDSRNATCYIHIAIGDPDYYNRGYGADALKTLCNYLFNEVNIRKIQLEVLAYNVRAIRCYEKLGFKHEGRRLKEIYRNGKYYDECLTALFKNDFKYHYDFIYIDEEQ